MNVIYARVSTEEQSVSGYSIQAQTKSCNDRYASMGVTDAPCYIDDGYSGEFIERPALDRLRADIRAKKISRIMIYDPDRMSRNLTVQLILADEIEKANIELLFVTGDYDASPEGRLFFSMKGAISAYEKAKIRERTMSGKRAKALSGKLTYNDNPIGYDYDHEKCNYIVNPVEAETIKLIYNTYLSDGGSLEKTAVKLRALDLTTKKGFKFQAGGVHQILKNEMYCGTKQAFKKYGKKISQYKRVKEKRDQSEWVPIQVPAIVTREVWDAVQRKLSTNRGFAPKNVKHDYLLRGFIVCGLCGHALIGTTNNKPYGSYHNYVCCTKYASHREPCPAPRFRSANIDTDAWEILVNYAKKGIDINTQEDTIDNSTSIKARINSLIETQTAIAKWVAEGTLSIISADPQLKSLKKEIDTLQSMVRVKPPTKINFNPAEILAAVTFGEKRKLIETIGCKFSVTKDTIKLKFT